MHSFVSCHLHVVWSTHRREAVLDSEIRDRLWPCLGGIARDYGIETLAIGGVADHVHTLVSLPSTLSISKAVQLLKGNSSKWLHETFPKLRDIAWQEEYGAFSIGVSGIDETIAYIRAQEEHHRTRTFQEEVELFLRRHGMEFHPDQLE